MFLPFYIKYYFLNFAQSIINIVQMALSFFHFFNEIYLFLGESQSHCFI